MKRKPNQGAHEQRAIAERFGTAQRTHLYKRMRAGRPFALFVIDGRLALTSYPSARQTWLQVDFPACMAGIYIEMPEWSRLLHDIDATISASKTPSTSSRAA